MKQLLFRKRRNIEKRSKTIVMKSVTEEKDSITSIRKSFLYAVSPADHEEPIVERPQMFIRKCVDSEKGTEKCRFRVKGYFYITHERRRLKITFHHNLNIVVTWKKKIFSPKKSEVLTD